MLKRDAIIPFTFSKPSVWLEELSRIRVLMYEVHSRRSSLKIKLVSRNILGI